MKYKYFYEKRFSKLVNLLEPSQYYFMDNIGHKFINQIMKNGKRSPALATFMMCLSILKKLTFMPPIYFLKIALMHCRPFFTISTIKKGRYIRRNLKLLNPTAQFRGGVKFIFQLANKFKPKSNVLLQFPYRLAISILNCYFKLGPISKFIKRLGHGLNDKYLKLSDNRINKLLNIRFKRTRKTRGFYHMNKYGLYKKLTFLI